MRSVSSFLSALFSVSAASGSFVLFFLLSGLAMPALCGSGPGGNQYYVSTSGSDSRGDGSESSPWETIQYAVNSAPRGGTVVVREGTYAEQVVLKDGVNLKAYEGERPAISGEGRLDYGLTSLDAQGVHVRLSDIEIDGFEIYGQAHSGILIRGRDSKNIVIRNCVIRNVFIRGVFLWDLRDSVVENNRIYMIGNHQEAMGILLNRTRNCRASGNQIYLVKKDAIRDTGYGNIIEGNVLYESYAALSINTASGSKVYNNYVFNCTVGFIPKHLMGDDGWTRFWHNTVENSAGVHIDIAVNRGRVMESSEPDLEYLDIRNNILGFATEAHINDYPDITDKVVIDGNLYVREGVKPKYLYTVRHGRGGRPAYRNIEAFRERTGYEKSGLEISVESYGNGIRGRISDLQSMAEDLEGVPLESPYGTQIGARGLESVSPLFERVPLSAADASTGGHLVQNSIDNNRLTYWDSASKGRNQWILYRLEKKVLFKYIVLQPAAHRVPFNIKGFDFEVSDDRRNFRSILKGENSDSGSMFVYQLEEPVSAKYLRLNIVDNFSDSEESNIRVSNLYVGYLSD